MPPRIRAPAALPQPQACRGHTTACRGLSTTACRGVISNARWKMIEWLNSKDGQRLATGDQGPQYLGPLKDQPFPLNPLFRSQPVLSDKTKNLIWHKVMMDGEPLKAVSAEMGIDVRRVAAVVRLKETERQWVADGKRLATPYAKAVLAMLPQTDFVEGERNEPHEPVNEVHVHKLTMQQVFVPVSESRRFTREDAAKAFHAKMLSADKRSPQPQLIAMERDVLGGMSRRDSMARFYDATQAEEEAVAQRILKQQQDEEERTTRVGTERCEFRFKDVSVDDVGRDGRSRRGTGWRYGAPLDDRKRGAVKIPTSVP